jgi:glycosyltransferase involved in cell wall biosynthesis
MLMPGKVAVVMPCYNAERWIVMTMNSLINQNCDNYVIFAVNDGSEDRTEEILREFAARFPAKVRILSQKNKGCGEALNRGFDAANEEDGFDYGTMVSADNLYYPHFILSLSTALDHEPESVAMVYGDFNYIDEQNRLRDTLIHQPKDKTDLINGYDQGMAFMFRMGAKNKAGRYWKRICEDYPMAVKIAQYGDFVLVPLVLAAFRISDSQLTGSNKEEEERAAEYSRRLARRLLLGDETISLDDVYPSGVDPWKHRTDQDVNLDRYDGAGGGLDDV